VSKQWSPLNEPGTLYIVVETDDGDTVDLSTQSEYSEQTE